jgi:hypothetical protein
LAGVLLDVERFERRLDVHALTVCESRQVGVAPVRRWTMTWVIAQRTRERRGGRAVLVAADQASARYQDPVGSSLRRFGCGTNPLSGALRAAVSASIPGPVP